MSVTVLLGICDQSLDGAARAGHDTVIKKLVMATLKLSFFKNLNIILHFLDLNLYHQINYEDMPVCRDNGFTILASWRFDRY